MRVSWGRVCCLIHCGGGRGELVGVDAGRPSRLREGVLDVVEEVAAEVQSKTRGREATGLIGVVGGGGR